MLEMLSRPYGGWVLLTSLPIALANDSWDIVVGKTVCASAMTEEQVWDTGSAFGMALTETYSKLSKDPFVLEVQESVYCGEGVFGYDVQMALDVKKTKDISSVKAEIDGDDFNGWYAQWIRDATRYKTTVYDLEQVTCASLATEGQKLCPIEEQLQYDWLAGDAVTCMGSECKDVCCIPLDPCPLQTKSKHCNDKDFEGVCWWNAVEGTCVKFPEKCWQIEDRTKCEAAPGCEYDDENFDSCISVDDDKVPCRAIDDEAICSILSNGWCQWKGNKCGPSDDRDTTACIPFKKRGTCNAPENEGICIWDITEGVCARDKNKGIKCNNVSSRSKCNEWTDGNCMWMNNMCNQTTKTYQCNEYERAVHCKEDDACEWSQQYQFCVRVGDGVPCDALDEEDLCLMKSGGYCEWSQKDRQCIEVDQNWGAVCAEFETRSSCSKERLNRCVWDVDDGICLPVEVDGIGCKDVEKQSSCEAVAGNKCAWNGKDGCVSTKGTSEEAECSDLTSKNACLAPGGCLWDQKEKQCTDFIQDDCAASKTSKLCKKNDECTWDEIVEVCFETPEECNDRTYWTCMTADECEWVGKQKNGSCEDLQVDCESATSSDDCSARGCQWNESSGKKKKGSGGTCVEPVATPEPTEPGDNVCAGNEHHWTMSAQKKHCDEVSKAKHCPGRGCQWNGSKCKPLSSPECMDIAASSCCRIPGCSLVNDACVGEFTGWL